MSTSDPNASTLDFSAFGATERTALSKIQQFAGRALARNWATIPHVTHHDEADITELDVLRKEASAAPGAMKLTVLPFLMKAAVAALRAFPHFNASLDADGRHLILKKYFHIGFAADTPAGLLVPVVRDCDSRTLRDIAGEIAAVSEKARVKGLAMAEMSGGCFTVSSLGSIGGTGFTPIINAPKVAILGVATSQWKPRRETGGDTVQWRLMLPLSLSYDHRVINGADAARFVRVLARGLEQPRTLLGDVT